MSFERKTPMSEKIEREMAVEAPVKQVWDAVTGDGWLADEVVLDLQPGGDAWFRSSDWSKTGWVEDVLIGERLAFWWAGDGDPATRVELTLTEDGEQTLLRVVETRPLELLDLVATPLPGVDGKTFGPALMAA
jgi:uncharacterized protein YndB with AHSA1/START domain